MTHWRKRVWDEALNILLQESLVLALKSKDLKPQDLTKVTVETTVQEKAVTFPPDAELHYKAIERLGAIAKGQGIDLRQSYGRVAKKALIMVQRYRHAKQMKRAKKAMRKLHTYLGRIIRDVERKGGEMEGGLLEAFLKANRIYHQKRKESHKLLSWHAPEVECIGKGKPHKPYEFGNYLKAGSEIRLTLSSRVLATTSDSSSAGSGTFLSLFYPSSLEEICPLSPLIFLFQSQKRLFNSRLLTK